MFEAERFFTYAEALVQAGGGEEADGATANRVYYSCHLEARDSMSATTP